MVQGYYTLQEAAQVLGMAPEDLKAMAQRNQIRSFQDRGTWRFRVQDIQELARQRGATSDLDLILGESPGPKSSGPKSAGPKSAGPKSAGAKSGSKSALGKSSKSQLKSPEVFDFAVDTGSEEDFGLDLFESPSGVGKKPDSKKPQSNRPAPPSGDDDLGFGLLEPSGINKPTSNRPESKTPDSPRPQSAKEEDFGLDLFEVSGSGIGLGNKPKSALGKPAAPPLADDDFSIDLEPSGIHKHNKPDSKRPPTPRPSAAPSPAAPPPAPPPADDDFGLDLFEVPTGSASGIRARPRSAVHKPAEQVIPDEDFSLDLEPSGITRPDSKKPGNKPPSPPPQGAKDDDFGLALLEPSGINKPAASPRPMKDSESDVKLVLDGGGDMGFAIGAESGQKHGSDSDVKLVGQSGADLPVPRTPGPTSPPRLGPASPPRQSMLKGTQGQATPPVSPAARKSSLAPPPAPDSGVRLVPMTDSDSDVKIVSSSGADVPLGGGATDSDIRLELPSSSIGRGNEGMLTEEINLDEELKKRESQTPKPQAKVKPKSKLPQQSPFELSDDSPVSPGSESKDSSDFDLTPAAAKLSDSSDDFSLELPDDSDMSIDLGDTNEASLAGPSSGISLENPVDAGISLEEGSDDLEFELSLDDSNEAATPRPSTPKPSGKGDDSDSEFELSLDVDDSSGSQDSLEAGGDDSEFELTLDDSGLMEEDVKPPPQKKTRLGGKSKVAKDSDIELSVDDEKGEKDIFDTDFEVPPLDEESGSEVAALDTDLDSSDFDLAMDSSDVEEDESGSQVVALDDDDQLSIDDDDDGGVATKRKPAKKKKKKDDDEEVADDDIEVDEDIEVEEEPASDDFSFDEGDVAGSEEETVEESLSAEKEEVVLEKVIRPAPWGVVPTVLMLPCVVVMILVGIMGFEMIQHMIGYKPPGFLTKTFSELVGKHLK